DRGVLVEASASPFDGAGEAVHELGGMDGRTVRREQGAEIRLAPDERGRLVGAQLSVVVLAEAPRTMILQLGPKSAEMRGDRRDQHRAAPGPVAVDVFGSEHAFDLVERGEHRALHRDDGLATVAPRGRRAASCEDCTAPATVATRRTEADSLAFTDHDA